MEITGSTICALVVMCFFGVYFVWHLLKAWVRHDSDDDSISW